MDREQQERGELDVDGEERELRDPGRGGDKEVPAFDGAPMPSKAPTEGATSASGNVGAAGSSIGAWSADGGVMGAMGLASPEAATPAKAPPAPKPAPAAPAWEADNPMMRAMGLGDAPGAGGPDGGDATKAEGVATPPKGQAQGRVTPDIEKAREAKKKLSANPAAKAAAEKAPPAAAGGAAPPGGGGAAKAAAAPAKAAAPGAAPASTTAAPQTAPAGGAPPGGAAPGGGGTQTQQAPGQPPPPGDGAPGPGGATAAPGKPVGQDDTSVEALIHTLGHDRDPGARRKAAEALGKLTAAKARAALEKAIRDPDAGVANAARAALKQLG